MDPWGYFSMEMYIFFSPFQTEDLEHISKLTRGYTSAEMVDLCKKALKIAMESSKENMVHYCSLVLHVHRKTCRN